MSESAKWGLTVYEPSPFDTHSTKTIDTYILIYIRSKVLTYVLKPREKGPYVLESPYVFLANECNHSSMYASKFIFL